MNIVPIKISSQPPDNSKTRRAARVLAMVHELHKVGYQSLRIFSGMSPTGIDWRCEIFPKSVLKSDGLEPALVNEHLVARYTTGQEDLFFDWSDASGKSARQLASMFIERFPEICRHAAEHDYLYAGWFCLVVGHSEHGNLPVFYQEYQSSIGPAGYPPDYPAKNVKESHDQVPILPDVGGSIELIEKYALSFDGYGYAKENKIELSSDWFSGVCRGDLTTYSADSLRLMMFFLQRKWKWNDQVDRPANEVTLMRSLLRLIINLRRTQQ